MIHHGDALSVLRGMEEGSVHMCVTSPPYWGLRDYGVEGQLGMEKTPDEFIEKMVAVFREVRRVLRDDGTLWLNLGDSYAASGKDRTEAQATNNSTLQGGLGGQLSIPKQQSKVIGGLKPKDLCMIPWRLALALQADGWWLRSIIAWCKKSPMPESVTDRPTSSWEPIFLLTKSAKYFYDAEAVREPGTRYAWTAPQFKGGDITKHHGNENGGGGSPEDSSAGRNLRNVWHLGPEPYSEAHFATYPTEIPRRAILAGTSEKGCCPRCGAPWERITSKEQVKRERPNEYVKPGLTGGAYAPPGQAPHGNARVTANSCANSVAGVSVKTIGWEPTCNCGESETVPCTVLDPFLGSGTTAQVARSLGRKWIGIELNREYITLAEKRIRQPCKWEPGYDAPKAVQPSPDQRSLF